MKKLHGKPILGGTAIGRMYYFSKEEKEITQDIIDDTDAEMGRFEAAKATALEQLHELYDKSLAEIGAEHAEIFEAHAMMLEDGEFGDSIVNMIRDEKMNAEYAVYKTGEFFAGMFASMEDEYMSARAADVKDITNRVIRILQGVQGGVVDLGNEPVILAAEDLTPSETVSMDKSKLLAFVTRYGSENSHTAILARTMNIPALIGVDISPDWDSQMAIVDGYEGTLYLDPDEETLAEKRAGQEEEKKKRELLDRLKGQESVTADGKKIKVYANIGSVEDVDLVLANDGEGIGLFRSEFLYLEKDHWPTEEEQLEVYKTVAEKMGGKKVIIRTLDLGADKQAAYFELADEENPAMGLRAIRVCLEQPDIFKTQLRALYRASVFGNLAIMFPMITSLWEVQEIKRIAADVKEELNNSGVVYGEVELGVMIETPAAVMISEELSQEVDFLSIGTNDLTQYTLAIDRQNQKLDRFYDAHHPAVLKMIQMTIDSGHKNGAWVGICGELGADMTLTETLVKMGIDELSVSPAFVLPIRDRIQKISSK